jgi:signal transduction histidine kinase
VRLRLTLLYGALFLLAGAALLGITYGLAAGQVVATTGHLHVSGAVPQSTLATVGAANALHVSVSATGPDAVRLGGSSSGTGTGAGAAPSPQALQAALRILFGKPSKANETFILAQLANDGNAIVTAQLDTQRGSELQSLLTVSGIALAIMALASVGLGWLMAGRVLRPLRTMTTRAQAISESNLHERLALDGPDDELRELADTFDGLLERLERAFVAQRRFVANASHELRTPLTLERAMVEVALADPAADVASLRAICERVIATGEEQERLIEALLALARSERGIERRERFDLADVVGEALGALGTGAAEPLPVVEATLDPAPISGDRRLVKRLVVNLLDNAVRHNVPDGWIRVRTGASGGRATLRIANSGAQVAPEDVDALLEPFRRATPDRGGWQQGHGLGLSIAAAIAESHGARIQLTARDAGGLAVEVAFPGAAEDDEPPASDVVPPVDRQRWRVPGTRRLRRRRGSS